MTNGGALINFGDGQSEGPVIPVQKGNTFEFVDSHTYAKPGDYTVTVMIAVPGSQKPNDNTVTVQVTVNSQGAPRKPPPSQPSGLTASGVTLKAKDKKVVSGQVARIVEAGAKAQGFTALINWGDRSATTSGRIRALGKGRFQVLASHRYLSPGLFHVTIAIEDANTNSALARTTIRVHK